MHRRLAACLMLSALMPHAQATAQSPRLPSTDSALVSYAGIVAVERLSSTISNAAHKSTSKWWKFTAPESSVPERWAALRKHLMLAVRGRDSVATDSTYSYIGISGVQVYGDTLRFWLDIGGAFRCPKAWYGNGGSYRVQAVRSDSTWMLPPRIVESISSHSRGCP